MKDTTEQLIVAISSRALFDLQESDAVFEDQGIDAYSEYQISRENEILKPGTAFALVQKLLNLNKAEEEPLVEVILLSRNSADTGLRIFNSIQHYELGIGRAAFTSGKSPYQYVSAFGAHLFLSTDQSDVHRAIQAGCAAAKIWPSNNSNQNPDQLKIAFDGDAVLFTDASEKIFEQHGIEAFHANEAKEAGNPLPGGPFKGFLEALAQLQKRLPEDNCPLRTALITARQAPAHERVIRTLRSWHIRIDEALFLGGRPKGEFLQAFQADIFFDDRADNCHSAKHHVTTAQVPREI